MQIIYDGFCFGETADGLQQALHLIGVPSLVFHLKADDQSNSLVHEALNWPEVFFIVLGPGLYKMPHRYIFVQTEQLSSPFWDDAYKSMMSAALHIWDFSPYDIEMITRNNMIDQSVGISTLPMYVPRNTVQAATDSTEQVYDVLFYGGINDHRLNMLRELESVGLVVYAFDQLYGQQRLEELKKAKIVLNLHYYSEAALEVHRLNFLLSLGKCVVSEPSVDAVLDDIYADGIVFASSERIGNTVLQLAGDAVARADWQHKALVLSARLQNNFTPLVTGIEAAVKRSLINPL
jgi:hypothetical protein